MTHIQQNFMKAMRSLMIEHSIDTDAEFAAWLGVAKQTIYQIARGRMPTVEQIHDICRKGGISANWLLLGIGEMKTQHQATLDEILKAVKAKK